MSHVPTVNFFREISTGDVVLCQMGPHESIPYASVCIEEAPLPASIFRAQAWDLLSQSLDSFFDRSSLSPPEKTRQEIRQGLRTDKDRQKRYLLFSVHRLSDNSIEILVYMGKKGRWNEVGSLTIERPSSNDDFVKALEEVEFLSSQSEAGRSTKAIQTDGATRRR